MVLIEEILPEKTPQPSTERISGGNTQKARPAMIPRAAATAAEPCAVEVHAMRANAGINNKHLSEPKDDERQPFKFMWIENAVFSGLRDKETQELMYKWCMQERFYIKRFIYDKLLEAYNIQNFLVDLFNNNPNIRVAAAMDTWGTLGRVTDVTAEATLHSVTTMSFFDRLREKGIVRQSGEIRKCLDEYIDQFLIADELRKCLLLEHDPTYDIFSKEDRREFIFHLFKAMCLGGRLCQYEDELAPYLDVTRKLYKDLVTVTKDANTGKLRVASLIYKITSVASSVSALFPMEHPQNFCYVCIDPMRRHVNVMYHASDQYY